MSPPKVHPSSIVDGEVGENTSVFAFTHILAGAAVGHGCHICDHVFIDAGAVVGNRCTVKNGAMVFDGVTLEDDVFVGPGVIFSNDKFPRSNREGATKDLRSRYSDKGWCLPTQVRTGAAIGAGAVICPGVEIGEYAMVGAGAVVTASVGAHELVVGQPAKPIGLVCRCGERITQAGRTTCPCGVTRRIQGGKLVTG